MVIDVSIMEPAVEVFLTLGFLTMICCLYLWPSTNNDLDLAIPHRVSEDSVLLP